MKLFYVFIAVLFVSTSQAQIYQLSGLVKDSKTNEVLNGASITIYTFGNVSGSISNREGKFSVSSQVKPDSLRFSMIGYRSKLFVMAEIPHEDFITVSLEAAQISLNEVVVRSVNVMNIVRRAVQKMPSFIPSKNYESKAFYREMIRDSSQYYSVAEAIFDAQFNTQQKSFKLKMEKGRSKEDVAYTRLFEDFHPGGGPQDAVSQSLVIKQPDFLTESNLKNYTYKLDSTILRDDRPIYVISFDQQQNVKEALEKGRIYIDGDDYSVWKFEAENSPGGTPYIKSLKGTDKIFARILGIDLTIKGWARTAAYTKIGDKLFLNYAKMAYAIDYKQQKKAINLSLMISSELVVTDFQRPVVHEITKDEEWKRKNLAVNLPADFDRDFWGANTILNPTAEVKEIISSISQKNKEVAGAALPGDWQYLNKQFFTSYKNGDSIMLVPFVKCSWRDSETGGMIYKTMKGDFTIEAKVSLKKRGNTSQEPDKGFQQSGIIVRQAGGKDENHIIFSMGTGGSDKPKYFLESTTGGKTKETVNKTNSLTGWLRIVKMGNMISIYSRPDETASWAKVDEYKFDWAAADLQVGFSVMARFAGNGPMQRPDMKAVFSNVKIVGL